MGPGEAASGAMIGKYLLQGELARGGMGVVYRALDPVLRRPCALKLMLDGGVDPSGVERFLREARALARLRHPGIVDIYDAGVHGGQPFLVMEFVAGGSLAALVKREGPLDVRRALELIDRIARAIDAAHAEGILHRDLKPANVLLDGDGNPRVTDFGLARDTSGREQGITLGDQMLGTPHYMAPEQAGGEGHLVGPRSDVYGLGAVLFELVAGKPPFAGATSLNVVTQKLRGAPSARAARPDLPADVEFIIRRAMGTRPDDRYDSAAALAADVRRHLEGRPIEARPAGPLERAWKLARRHRALATLAAVILALAGVGAGLGAQALALRRRDEARDLEAQGLLLLDELDRAGGGLAAGAEEADRLLARATELDGDRGGAWCARARLALERGDLDQARRCLAAAGPDPGVRGGRAYVAARLAEAEGDLAGAIAGFAAAAAAGNLEADLPSRAARARAHEHTTRGWPVAATAAWWEALRADADDGEALAALVERGLTTRDLEALSRGWEEVLWRVAPGDEGTWQELVHADDHEVHAALRDERAPASARARAAVAACLFQRHRTQDALASLRDAPGPALAVEAARATGLATRDLTLAGWATTAAVTTWADGAAQALTLLEQAHRLDGADATALQALVRDARGPLLRAAVAYAIAVAATRRTPAGDDDAAWARALLDRLRKDDDPRVRGAAEDAAGALGALRGLSSKPSEGALLLAQRLLRTTDRPGRLLPATRGPDDRWTAACDAALAASPSAALHVARAEDAIERGAPAGWQAQARADVERALALEPGHLGARALAAQLRLVAGEESSSLEAQDGDDPEALRAAEERVAFAREHRAFAFDAGGGALRLVSAPGLGLLGRAFDLLAPIVEADEAGPRTLGVSVLRSRFTMIDVRSFAVLVTREGGEPIGFTVRAHAPLAGSLGGYRFDLSSRDAIYKVDGQIFRFEGQESTEGVTAVLRRAEVAVHAGSRPLIETDGFVRVSRARGPVEAVWGWAKDRHLLRRVVVVGRWDRAGGSWSAPAAPPRLRPASGALPLLAENIASAPDTLAALRAGGASFAVSGHWMGVKRGGQVLGVGRVKRDAALRARVVLRGTTRNYVQAGLVLRSSLGDDNVWLALGGATDMPQELGKRRLWLFLARGDEWNKPVRAFHADPLQGTVLWLERRGDYVVARAGPDERSLEDLGAPIYFPFDGPVDVALFGRGPGDARGEATFSEVELLLPE